MLLEIRGGEKEFSIELSVLMGVLDVDTIKSLTNSSGGLIGSEDSLSWGDDVLDSLNEFGFEVS